MIGDEALERLVQIFEEQFSSDEGGIIYRKGRTGPPIRVSAAERDTFVSDYRRRMRVVLWVSVCLIVAPIVTWTALKHGDASADPLLTLIVIMVILAVDVPSYVWARNGPARTLNRRTPEGAALTKAEARTLYFSETTYGMLAIAAFGGVVLVLIQSFKTDVFHGWGVLWLVFGAALIAGAAFQALGKWLFGSRP